MPDHQDPQALLALQVKRDKWAQVFKDQKVKKANRGSLALQECQERLKLNKK